MQACAYLKPNFCTCTNLRAALVSSRTAHPAAGRCWIAYDETIVRCGAAEMVVVAAVAVVLVLVVAAVALADASRGSSK